MKRGLASLLIMLTVLHSEAQVNRTPATQPNATIPKILMTPLANGPVQFSANLRPLNRVAGAPAPYYTYFWEFGDGTFSDATRDGDKPIHRYKTSGTYQVRLLATNNYDNGEATSLTGSFDVRVSPVDRMNAPSGFFEAKDLSRNVKLKVNRHPRAGEELVAYLGYRNRRGNKFSGSLVLFFNDRRFLRRGFRLMDKRLHNGEERSSLDRLAFRTPDAETSGPPMAEASGHQHTGGIMQANTGPGGVYNYLPGTNTLLHTTRKKYLDNMVFRFSSVPEGEERFVFLSMQALPEMISDTNAVISMTALMIPDDPLLAAETYELEVQIVVSHDPNRMLLRQTPINYRFMRKNKELSYKVEFQNMGTGPARNISVGIALPAQFNTASLVVKGVSPAAAYCDSAAPGQSCVDTVRTADSIRFVFRNIYLPGLRQNLVSHEDSTKGFIEYAIRFKKRPKKIPFSSRAVILFDRNEPIYTNKATARFVKGISPGISAGYNLSISNGDYSARGPIQIGYILAPYAPFRPYFQIEAHAAILQRENSTSVDRQLSQRDVDSLLKGSQFISGEKQSVLSKKRNGIQIVPLHLRYNINSWIGIGVGVRGQIAISEQAELKDKFKVKIFYERRTIDTLITRTRTLIANPNRPDEGNTKWWTDANIAPFADIQVGRVRTGPTLGLRYYRQWKSKVPDRFFVYAACKL